MDFVSIVASTGSYQLKINHSETKDMDTGKWVTSPMFRVGRHDWVIMYFPRGNNMDNSNYVSVFLELQRESTDVSATFDLAILDKKGNVSSTTSKNFSHTFTSHESDWGLPRYLARSKLEETYIKDDFFILDVSITVKDEYSYTRAHQNTNPIHFPSKRLQEFRENNKCTDVTFNVDGKSFVAHKLILAAHSPVFEAEFFGSMAESNLNGIMVKEMAPSVFKAMLDFMYDGSLAINEETVDGSLAINEETVDAVGSTLFLHHLLAAADRYAVEELKAICEHKLIESISFNTVLSLLGFAEKHTCSELKKNCFKFIVAKDNLLSLTLTEGYIKLMQNYPSLLAELKDLAGK